MSDCSKAMNVKYTRSVQGKKYWSLETGSAIQVSVAHGKHVIAGNSYVKIIN